MSTFSNSTNSTSNPFDNDEEVLTFSEIISHCDKLTIGSRNVYKIFVKDLMNGIDKSDIIYNENNRFVDKSRRFDNFDITTIEPIILGFKDDKYHILDGQHRIEYLKCNHQYDNDYILIDIRVCNDEIEIMRQLQIINDRRIMKVEIDTRKIKYGQFIELFKNTSHFKVIFKKNRPYINPDTLSSVIVNSDYFQSSQNKPIDILNKIIQINNFISKLPKNKWSIETIIDDNYIQKAKETRYYLTFDKEYYPIKELIDVEISTFDAKWNDFLTKRRKRRLTIK